MTDALPRLQLVAWHSRAFGPRYTLEYQGQPILTFGSELEARRAAKQYGWRVAAGDPFRANEE